MRLSQNSTTNAKFSAYIVLSKQIKKRHDKLNYSFHGEK